MRRALAALAVMAALATAGAAQAQEGPRLRGLIVGASDYGQGGLGLAPLTGPRNDALLMADFLIGRGAARRDLILLTDGVERAEVRPASPIAADAPPTRAEIEAAFRRLADQAQAGDQVVILLSGHGWRQAERRAGSEPDGMDELFLPADYGPMPPDAGEGALVPGAVTDDEIGAWIDAIRDRGADVVLIADFCHAGDSTRGEPGAVLREPRLDTPGQRRGGYVAFFAAPAGGRAMQGLAPIWSPREARAPHGLLTVYTIAALGDPSVATYAEAARRVQASLLEHDVRDHALRLDAPAEFEGALDRPIFGGLAGTDEVWTVLKPAMTPSDGRVAIDRLTLNAGALQGVTEGSLVAVTDASGGAVRVLFYGRAVEVSPVRSVLVPVAYEGFPEAAWADVRTTAGRAYTDRRLWGARLVERAVDLEFRVAGADGLFDPASLSLDGARLRRVRPGGEAELHLHEVADGSVLLSESPDPRDARAVLGSVEAGSGPQALADALARAARAWRLRLILGRLAADAGSDGEDLATDYFLWRPPGGPSSGRCPPFDPRHAALRDRPPPDATPLALTGDGAVTLRPCDVIFARVANAGETTLDVSALAFAPDGAIWALPWADDREAVRFEPGRARLAAYQLDATGSGGRREELMLVAVRSDPMAGGPVSFARLRQPGVGSGAPMTEAERTRSGPGHPLAALLDEVRLDGLRSAQTPVQPDGVAVRRLSVRVAD